jgi:acetyl esterase/lipase
MMRAILAAGALALAAPAAAQLGLAPVAAPAEPDAIPLGTGGVPQARAPESWFLQGGLKAVRNVQAATLTPVLPDPAKATGAAVIVAPGGGFLMLSMENEGWPVARALADRGIAAFVLKYRLTPTAADLPGFQRELIALFSGAARPDSRPGEGDLGKLAALPAADAAAALAMVRARAKEWRVDPARVGMLGFSAGAMTTLATTLKATPETMPAFIAPVYGPMDAIPVPAGAPPMFNVLASDDPLFARKGLGLIDAWQQARRPVEFHLYQKGGHGFGMGLKGTTSTGWMNAFVRWLDSNGFLKAKP